jgi:hypothetical protein
MDIHTGGIHRDDNKKARLENNHFSKNRCQLERALSKYPASGMQFLAIPNFIRDRARKEENTSRTSSKQEKKEAAPPGGEKVVRMIVLGA